MSTIILYGGGITLLIAILLSLPLVKHIAKPFLDALVSGFGLMFKHTGSYVVWATKSIIGAHFTVLSHLLHGKKYFDPTVDIKRQK